ncbi:AAA family ATPase [Cohaesibacter sp. CAU 1516]|uniref:AAA family ATPase n=1 Tax=Cohaesibacter sp. CAU 1516 TaxID=2576038 RepID=UPI001AED6C7D|nr:AAA family ATPase [Cohaesibacter sp. CAU 1516]
MLSDRFILLTGCSGGGKSTLLSVLAERGLATISEPGRRIVADELAGDGRALPWVDMQAFARRAVALAISDLEAARHFDGLVFFDRGLIDAAVALEHSGGQKAKETLGNYRPYAQRVFIAPPWQELFVGDAERRHDFDMAVQEYHRISRMLDDLGHTVSVLPKVSLSERADIVLSECGVLSP